MWSDEGATLNDSPDGASHVTSGGGSDSAAHEINKSSSSELVTFPVLSVELSKVGGEQTNSALW